MTGCHCLCGLPKWSHLGICNGAAETTVRLTSPIEPGHCDVQVCYPCATAILAAEQQQQPTRS